MIKKQNKIVLTIMLLAVFLISTNIIRCKDEKMTAKDLTYNTLKEVPDSEWEKLSRMKIYFGHQSVGYNIVDGLNDLKKEYPAIKLNIVETDKLKELDGGAFAHSKIGKNREIDSKFKDFENIIGNSNNIDVAFLKSCYVDVTEKTDIQAMFLSYKSTMNRIENANSNIKVVHFTVPLEMKRIPFSHWLKIFRNAGWSYRFHMVKTVGNLWRKDANIKRNEYNGLITSEYKNKELLFDIAKFESSYSDGNREKFKQNGNEYYAMVPIYSDDGGHLNELGRKVIAEKLLLFLVNL